MEWQWFWIFSRLLTFLGSSPPFSISKVGKGNAFTTRPNEDTQLPKLPVCPTDYSCLGPETQRRDPPANHLQPVASTLSSQRPQRKLASHWANCKPSYGAWVPSQQPGELRPHAPPAPGNQVTAGWRSHVAGARPPVVAMAAAGSSVVRRVEELGDLAQAHIQQLSEAAGEDDHFLIRASAALEKLKLLCGEDKECSNPSNLLELYTQAILDMTYFEENKLVDEDFPEDSSQKVKELISFLSEPEILVKENNMHPKPCDLLGDELLECLSWRRGALLYMYCHSLTKRREWLTRKSNLLKKYLIDGISYLLQMLNYRCPVQLNEGVSFQDLDTAKLLSEGIFSDIHLLAMMYSGEMCYWGLKHCADQQPENHEVDSGVSGASYTTQKEPLDFREVGEKILKKYVFVCEGPLKEQEWNTTNAKQILNFFQHHTNQ
ncbi:UPF0600 protein C5orf51 homolog isoform X2 [Mustela putorius furo]|uniref:UPF0600 protein C5orf51 homolog isoform X2 n=1 Tax=Mustela putorius furo TaxID=9669 RepID=A0A8U0S2W0_MUSPF|nr:UPF0600 protein C5orf51 homolog isoform X2 [Mustela putorius furo]